MKPERKMNAFVYTNASVIYEIPSRCWIKRDRKVINLLRAQRVIYILWNDLRQETEVMNSTVIYCILIFRFRCTEPMNYAGPCGRHQCVVVVGSAMYCQPRTILQELMTGDQVYLHDERDIFLPEITTYHPIIGRVQREGVERPQRSDTIFTEWGGGSGVSLLPVAYLG